MKNSMFKKLTLFYIPLIAVSVTFAADPPAPGSGGSSDPCWPCNTVGAPTSVYATWDHDCNDDTDRIGLWVTADKKPKICGADAGPTDDGWVNVKFPDVPADLINRSSIPDDQVDLNFEDETTYPQDIDRCVHTDEYCDVSGSSNVNSHHYYTWTGVPNTSVHVTQGEHNPIAAFKGEFAGTTGPKGRLYMKKDKDVIGHYNVTVKVEDRHKCSEFKDQFGNHRPYDVNDNNTDKDGAVDGAIKLSGYRSEWWTAQSPDSTDTNYYEEEILDDEDERIVITNGTHTVTYVLSEKGSQATRDCAGQGAQGSATLGKSLCLTVGFSYIIESSGGGCREESYTTSVSIPSHVEGVERKAKYLQEVATYTLTGATKTVYDTDDNSVKSQNNNFGYTDTVNTPRLGFKKNNTPCGNEGC